MLFSELRGRGGQSVDGELSDETRNRACVGNKLLTYEKGERTRIPRIGRVKKGPF